MPPPASTVRPPNVVLLLADDLGYRDLGFEGGRFPTPNIDGIRARGVRFTAAYTAAPMCSSSRAALLTGRHPARLGYDGNPSMDPNSLRAGLPPEDETLSSLLQLHGYRTAAIGKVNNLLLTCTARVHGWAACERISHPVDVCTCAVSVRAVAPGCAPQPSASAPRLRALLRLPQRRPFLPDLGVHATRPVLRRLRVWVRLARLVLDVPPLRRRAGTHVHP